MPVGKLLKNYRRKSSASDRTLARRPVTLAFYHKFTQAGLTELDLTALNMPSEITGFNNPSAAQIAAAMISLNPDSIQVFSSAKLASPINRLSFTVASDTRLLFSNGFSSQVDEIIYGVIQATISDGVYAVDGTAKPQTGTLLAGLTDIVVSEPFIYNKNSDQQIGDCILIIDGFPQYRNIGNTSTGLGNFYEVAPTAGRLSNTLRMNTSSTVDRNYIVLPVGFSSIKPTQAIMSRFQTIGGQLDQIIQDLAQALGVSTSRYQVQGNETDLAVFGNTVQSQGSRITNIEGRIDSAASSFVLASATAAGTTVTADTYVDVPGMSISLSPGVWDIGYDVSVGLLRTSGNPQAEVVITDAAGNVVSATRGFVYSLISAIDNAWGLSRRTRITIATTTTYKVRIRCSSAAAVATATVLGPNNTGSLVGDDNASNIWAAKVA